MAEWTAKVCHWVCEEDGWKNLRACETDDGRFPQFDVDISDVELFQDFKAPKGRAAGVFTSKTFRLHSYPKDDRRGVVSDLADANDVRACPIHPQLVQASMDLGGHLVLPDRVELMPEHAPELLKFAGRLRALGPLPWRGARAGQ